jgi:membrane AbrB-like protein
VASSGPAIPKTVVQVATLATGGLGGWAFAALGVPLPWLLGPLLTVGALGIAGLDLATPKGSRQLGQLLLGTGIGLNFTVTVALFVIDHAVVMVGCALASVAFGAIAAQVLKRTAGVDIATAYFSCVPGGVAEMAVQANRWGGDAAPVALAQSLRILFVVTTIPPAFILLDLTGLDFFETRKLPFDAGGFVLLLAISFASAGLLAWLKVTNAWILGPLAGVAAVTVAELDLSGVPSEVLSLSQVLIGSTIGLRYRRDTLVKLRRFLPPAVLSTLVLIGLNVLLALAVGLVTEIPAQTLVLSTSPGGMAEMAITAKLLGLGVPIVAAFHIVRIFIVIGCSGLLFKYGFRYW